MRTVPVAFAWSRVARGAVRICVDGTRENLFLHLFFIGFLKLLTCGQRCHEGHRGERDSTFPVRRKSLVAFQRVVRSVVQGARD